MISDAMSDAIDDSLGTGRMAWFNDASFTGSYKHLTDTLCAQLDDILTVEYFDRLYHDVDNGLRGAT